MQWQLGAGPERRRDRWLAWLKSVSEQRLLPLPFGRLWHELLIFGVLQAWACLFAGVLLGFIVLTRAGSRQMESFWGIPKAERI